MPSLFDRQFASSGFPQMLRAFGEPVTYHLASGASRSFTAIIERSPPAIYVAGEAVMPKFTVRFPNNCQTGVMAKEVNTGGDEMSLAAKINDMIPTRLTVIVLLSQDSSVTSVALL